MKFEFSDVTEKQMTNAVAEVRMYLRQGMRAAYAGDFTAAYGFFESAQLSAFDLKDLFAPEVTP